MLGRVGVDGFVGTSVDSKVGLPVAIQVQTTQRDWAGDWLLEDSSIDGCALVDDQTWPRDVQGNQLHVDALERINLHRYSDGAQLDGRPPWKDARPRSPWAVKSSSLIAVTKGPSSFARLDSQGGCLYM